MSLAQGKLPLRKDGQIETRPLHVEEWLETLPYADFQRTAQLLHEAMAATNTVAVKASAREELHGLYDQPYRYYLQSQIKAGAQHTLASMESMQQQLQLMKLLAADLAYMSQLIVNDAGKSKSLWGKKPPVTAVQQALAYLSQALIFNFLEYGPTPRNVWKQLHSLYRFAESIDKHHIAISTAGGGRTSVAHTYCRIVLTELVDPYHLPFGAIWEIYEQVDSWLDNIELLPYKNHDATAGLFVIDLNSDSPATAYDRFDANSAGDSHRLLDAGTLHRRAQQALDRILHGGRADGLEISDTYRRLLLAQMSRAWHLPPKRYFPRSRVNGELPVICGLKPTHFHMNGGRDFLENFSGSEPGGVEGLEVDDGPAVNVSQTGSHYTLEQWNMINKSSGGCALSRQQRPLYTVRVGDMIGLRLDEDGDDRNWQLGIIRWLMIDGSGHYRVGVKTLGTESKPVALRINGSSGEPLRGFLVNNNGEISVVTARDVLGPEQTIEVLTPAGNETLQTVQLIEEMAGSEQFSVCPLQP
ncbi:MAG: hypothetical protein U5P41_04065 [Gammaproteobacteria bacterium]|nr:hypothetical protein [Gammaproteobacteria bacterium]